MQVRDRQRYGEAPASAMDAGGAEVARGRPRGRALGITAAVACVTLLVVMAIISSREGSGLRGATQPSVVAPASGPDAEEISSTVSQEAMRWVDGLTEGLILPSDVTSRLAVQDPGTARIVMATWSDLSPAISTRSAKAVRWLNGLTDGLILPSDVTSRLTAQDPRTARIVMAAWSDLNP